MKLIFLFMSSKCAMDRDYSDWKPEGKCWNQYNELFYREGYFILLEKLLTSGVVSDLKIFYESNIGPGVADWINQADMIRLGLKVRQEVIPHISYVDQFVDDETIIWARGGFKHWHDWLTKYKNKNWLMLYSANTGRQKWDFWDIVLNDITTGCFLDERDRLIFPFIKPIDDQFYKPSDSASYNRYDLCIGASHIHDKKGQWRTIRAMQAYEDAYGRKLSAVMPGSPRRGERTVSMYRELEKNRLQVYCPGFVSKVDLVDIFNHSKIFIHLGTHGQNDRGPLEAAACGCEVILGSPEYHAIQLTSRGISKSPNNLNDYNEISWLINQSKREIGDEWKKRKMNADFFNEILGIDKSVSLMGSLLEMMKHKPSLNTKQLILAKYMEGAYGFKMHTT